MSSEDLNVYDLFILLSKDSFDIPEENKSDKIASIINANLQQLEKSNKENLSNLKMSYLLT
jgi:hypothetical protein